jgi:hypothetical protein
VAGLENDYQRVISSSSRFRLESADAGLILCWLGEENYRNTALFHSLWNFWAAVIGWQLVLGNFLAEFGALGYIRK